MSAISLFGEAEDLGDRLKRRRRWRTRTRLRFLGSIAENTERKGLFHHVSDPVLRINGRHLPDSRTRREHFDQREAQPAHLVLHGTMNCTCGSGYLLVVAKAHTLDVHRAAAR